MRLLFRTRPYDLFLAAAICVAMIPLVAIGPSPFRAVIGLLFVLFLPGYSIMAVLFPRDGEMDWVARIALSCGTSIAVVALLGIVVAYSPWGFHMETVLVALLAFTLGTLIAAHWRRMRLAPDERLALAVEISPIRWGGLSRFDRTLTLGLVASLILGVVAFAVAPSSSPHERFTEFYVLDSSGGVSAYPTQLNVNEEAVVILGIVNREARTVNYTVEVRLVAIQVVNNETVELWNSTLDSWWTVLEDSRSSEVPYAFRIPDPGDYHLRFRLFAGTAVGIPYRALQLPIRVV